MSTGKTTNSALQQPSFLLMQQTEPSLNKPAENVSYITNEIRA